MNRKPTEGDVIRIAGTRGDLIVVESQLVVKQDTVRGETYLADTFTTIRYSSLWRENPKTTMWKLPDGSINIGTEVSLRDIELVKSVTLRKMTTVVYGERK